MQTIQGPTAPAKPFRELTLSRAQLRSLRCVLAELIEESPSYEYLPPSHRIGKWTASELGAEEAVLIDILSAAIEGNLDGERKLIDLNTSIQIPLTEMQSYELGSACQLVHDHAYKGTAKPDHDHDENSQFWKHMEEIRAYLEETKEECGCSDPPEKKARERARFESGSSWDLLETLCDRAGLPFSDAIQCRESVVIFLTPVYENVPYMFIESADHDEENPIVCGKASLVLAVEPAVNMEALEIISRLETAGFKCGAVLQDDRDDDELFEISRHYIIRLQHASLGEAELSLFFSKGIKKRPHALTCTNYWGPKERLLSAVC